MRYFAGTSDFTSWDTLHEQLIILSEILSRNVWLYFMRYFVVISDLYFMRCSAEKKWLYYVIYFAGTSDYPSWDTLKKHLIILYCKLCRNIWLYFMKCFTEISDYTLWNSVQKHLIILHDILWRETWLYSMTNFAETSDYISWDTLQ
jgi:hypothetical protein